MTTESKEKGDTAKNVGLDDVHKDYLQERAMAELDKRVEYNLYNFPITNFLKYFENNQLYVPDYQRGLVWDDKQKELLVESIIINMPIGNIFLNDDRYCNYEIVDGQQRLMAIWDFYNNKFTWGGLFFKELPYEIRIRFEMGVVATYITTYKERKDIIELYYRINWAGTEHTLDELIAIDKKRKEGD